MEQVKVVIEKLFDDKRKEEYYRYGIEEEGRVEKYHLTSNIRDVIFYASGVASNLGDEVPLHFVGF